MQQAERCVSKFQTSRRLREQLARAVPFEQYKGALCVMYVDGGREKRTAWYSDSKRAERALAIVRRRCGNGIILID